MQRGRISLIILVLITSVALPLCAEEDSSETSAFAPRQHSQSETTAHPALFMIPDASQAFERDVYPVPDFLPPSLFQSSSERERIFGEEEDSGVQQAQYPTIDSAARDEDDEGLLPPPSRWNPIPYLNEQLACIPQEKRGLQSKEISVTDTVLLPAGDSYALNTVDVRSTVYFGQLPFLLFTPRFGWHVVGNGGPVGMPPQFFDAGLDTTLYLPLGQKWSFLGMVGPSIFSDGQNTTSQSFRLTGRALVFYKWSETVKLSGGFLYLDRVDIKALPAGGIFYQPRDDLKIELFFPRPRIAWRYAQDEDISSWCYLAGEFGGNSWAIERSNGTPDIMTLRDYRLVAGLEHVNGDDFRCLLEAGFVFGRKIEYSSGIGNTTQSPTAMLRGGLVF